MRKAGLVLFLSLLLVTAGIAQASDLRPLSPQDFAKVQELLKSFDPNSYDIRLRVQDAKGRVSPFRAGRAVGLANIRQTNTVRPAGGAMAASINTVIINIFKTASSVNTINVFKEAAPGAVSSQGQRAATDINVPLILYGNRPDLNSKAQQLNQILQKYYVP